MSAQNAQTRLKAQNVSNAMNMVTLQPDAPIQRERRTLLQIMD